MSPVENSSDLGVLLGQFFLAGGTGSGRRFGQLIVHVHHERIDLIPEVMFPELHMQV